MFAAHGDGTVPFTSATSATPDGWTMLHVRVTNAGTVRAVYTVELSAKHGTRTTSPAAPEESAAPIHVRLLAGCRAY